METRVSYEPRASQNERMASIVEEQLLKGVPSTRPMILLEQGACVGMDSNVFMDMRYKSGLAQRTCAGCSVRKVCLDYGKDMPNGIWGGLKPTQRGFTRQGARIKI